MLERLVRMTIFSTGIMLADPIIADQKQQLVDIPFWQEMAIRYVPRGKTRGV